MWVRTATRYRGEKFGRLTVIRVVYRPGQKAYESYFVCRCECGKTKEIFSARVLRGGTRSCGCLRKPKHDFESKEYRAWSNMKQRCYNSKNVSFVKYGAIGVSVAKTWLGANGFDRFFADVGPAPSPDHSLDRKNAFGNYTPKNVAWATSSEQAKHKRNFKPSAHPRKIINLLREKARGAWKNARYRCHNKTDPAFVYYGGRGIVMCAHWRSSFSAFLRDMGLPTSRHHTLDRRNPNKDYMPKNCRWATRQEQGETRRSTILVTHGGQTHSVSSWARKIGINHQTLRYRLFVKKESLGLVIKRATQ